MLADASEGQSRPEVAAREEPPLVVICMATYNPSLELFHGQIESIRAQTHERWRCIVSDDCSEPAIARKLELAVDDDPRFSFHRSARRLGVYRNFEHCLALVPAEADFVALADQDDRWYPHKLESLLAGFDGATLLAYSDMKIAGADGKVLLPTAWATRPNNYEDLASLLLANTVTGAASLFRASLLRYALPFPPEVGKAHHDQWVACVALALGRIRYVDRPLLEYVQHGENVVGHYDPPRDRFARQVREVARGLTRRGAKLTLGRLAARARELYFEDVLRVETIARSLDQRGGELIPEKKRRTLMRLARADESWTALLWLTFRGLRNLRRVSETLGAEYAVVLGALWKRLARR
jgi:glycosyltransferase involved in cell wall biosynthesis